VDSSLTPGRPGTTREKSPTSVHAEIGSGPIDTVSHGSTKKKAALTCRLSLGESR